VMISMRFGRVILVSYPGHISSTKRLDTASPKAPHPHLGGLGRLLLGKISARKWAIEVPLAL
jgi:hypothetical protein